MLTSLQKELIQLAALAVDNELDNAAETVLPLINGKNTPQENPSVALPTPEGMVAAVRSVLFPKWPNKTGRNLIAAIKLHRTLTETGLKESKDWVEDYFKVGYKWEV